MSSIHPALRAVTNQTYSSPTKAEGRTYGDGPAAGYSPLQPSPNHSYQGAPTPNYFGNSHQSHESAEEHSPVVGSDPNDPNDPNDLKRPRACEACRQLKVKCEPSETNPNGSCKRCAKASRQCVITAPSRKRQKKTDSRVAELEKKIDALTASLAARGGHEDVASIDPAIAQTQVSDAQRHRDRPFGDTPWLPNGRQSSMTGPLLSSPIQTTPGLKRKMTNEHEGRPSEPAQVPNPPFGPPLASKTFNTTHFDPRRRKPEDDEPYVDVIDRQMIDAKTAYRCFDRYHNEMCEQLPIVVFPPGVRAEDVRKTKPLLFLAILAAASGTIRPDLQSKFVTEVTRIFSDRIVFRGEKSMELCQTIQVMTMFYQPPEKYEELNFNQLIHIAAVMALDIGMGKRSKVGNFAMFKEYRDKKQPLPSANAAETRRCWLGIYYMCANSAMSLRRPLLIRWSPYSEECLEILSTAPDALPSDRWLCHLARAQHIGEKIGFQFSMDDPASTLSLTDANTQYHLKAFERQLKEWHESASNQGFVKPLVQHTEAIINLYMHEIAMHHNHNIDDFKPPYNITPLDGPTEPDHVTPAHIESLNLCLTSIHNAFDAFLSMDLKTLRALPTLFFVRNSYAAVALIKMYSAVSAPNSKFSTIFKVADLKVESYLDRMIVRLTKTAEGNASRVAHKFSFIFNMLKSWHLKRTEPSSGNPHRKGLGTRTPNRFPTPAPPPNPNTVNWNNTTMDQNSQAQRSGLQMLSDAAMVKDPQVQDKIQNQTPTQPNVDSIALAPSNNASTLNWPGAPIHHMMPSMEGQVNTDDPMMSYGMPDGDLDNLGFSADELLAMGNLMDDPGWFSFGLEQGGWAF